MEYHRNTFFFPQDYLKCYAPMLQHGRYWKPFGECIKCSTPILKQINGCKNCTPSYLFPEPMTCLASWCLILALVHGICLSWVMVDSPPTPPPMLWDEAGGALGDLRTMEGDCAQDLFPSLFIIHHPVHWIIWLPPDLWTHTCKLCSKRCQTKPGQVSGTSWCYHPWPLSKMQLKGLQLAMIIMRHSNVKLYTISILLLKACND